MRPIMMADMQIPKKGLYEEGISGATSITTPTEPTVSIPRPIDLIEQAAKGDCEIAESKEAVEALRQSEQRLRDVIDTIPTMAWTALPDGSVDFVSRSWLEYTGFSMEDCLNGGWNTVAYPEDLDRTAQKWQAALATGEPYECEVRTRTAFGSSRWCLSRAVPLRDEVGKIVKWYGTNTDIDERKKAEEKLQESEAYLAEAQRLSHTGSWAWIPATGDIRYWSEECYRVLGFDPHGGKPRFEAFFQRIHPDDQAKFRETAETAGREKAEFELDYRIVHPGGQIRDIHVVGHPVLSPSGDLVEFVGTVIDITEGKRAEEELRTSEAHLAEAQRLSHTGSWVWRVPGRDALHLSEEWYRIYGFDPEDGMPTWEERLQRIHPEDRAKWQGATDRAIAEKSDYEVEVRILLPDGTIKHIHTVGHPVFNASGDLVQFVGSSTDITERKQGEEKIRQSERELRQVLDFAPLLVGVAKPDRTRIYANQATLDYYGITLEDWRSCHPHRLCHPEDYDRMTSETQSKFLSGTPYETEGRLPRKDGKYRWFLLRYNPVRDEQGRVIRWYVAATDIEDRKQAEQRLQNENVALREEIDRASMLEEIVGVSPALHAVLSRVSK